MGHIFLGLAEGALEEIAQLHSGTNPSLDRLNRIGRTDDPYILANYGSFFVNLQAAQALTDIAGESLQRAWESGNAITENQRGRCALDIAASKVTTTKAGLEITTRMFDVMGARAAADPPKGRPLLAQLAHPYVARPRRLQDS